MMIGYVFIYIVVAMDGIGKNTLKNYWLPE